MSRSNARGCSISIVGPSYPYRGGIAHYVASLGRALAERGNRVNIINYRSLYPRFLFPGRTMFDESRSPLSGPESQRVLRPLAPWTWAVAARRLKRLEPDLVVFQWWHVFFAPALLSLLWACRLGGIRTAVLLHNVMDHDKHAVLNRTANALLRRTGATLVVHSARDAELLRSRAPAMKIVSAPHPPYTAFTEMERVPREEARRLLSVGDGPLCMFFGLVRSYKGLADLIGALAMIPAGRRPHLLVVGEFYEPEESYRKAIAEHGLDEWVTIENRYVPNEELPLYFAAADVLAAPYRTASQSGVVAIADAFGLPAIVSDAGGLPEMVLPHETGLVAPASDPPALARVIDTFFEQKLGAAMRERLNRRASECDRGWDQMCSALEGIACSASA
jgi:glycosyltransferase involved in cell wall biosynthesis